MRRAIITLFLLFFSIESCETKYILSGNKIEINNTIENDNKILDFINPYKNNVDKQIKKDFKLSQELKKLVGKKIIFTNESP